MKKTIVLVGMMGAGKTAVGTLLAKALGVAFVDSDAEIERAANMSISEIFARDGEAFFRERESQVIGRLLRGPPVVLSTGGGAFLREGNRAEIAAHAVSIWLKVPLDVLWSRVRHKDTRPLLRTENPHATLKALAEVREPIYAEAALTVESEANLAVEDMVQRVMTLLESRSGILGEM